MELKIYVDNIMVYIIFTIENVSFNLLTVFQAFLYLLQVLHKPVRSIM